MQLYIYHVIYPISTNSAPPMDPVHRTAGSSWTEQRDTHLGHSPVDTLTPVEKTSVEDQEEVALGAVEAARSRLGRIAVVALVAQCDVAGTGIEWGRNAVE